MNAKNFDRWHYYSLVRKGRKKKKGKGKGKRKKVKVNFSNAYILRFHIGASSAVIVMGRHYPYPIKDVQYFNVC